MIDALSGWFVLLGIFAFLTFSAYRSDTQRRHYQNEQELKRRYLGKEVNNENQES